MSDDPAAVRDDTAAVRDDSPPPVSRFEAWAWAAVFAIVVVAYAVAAAIDAPAWFGFNAFRGVAVDGTTLLWIAGAAAAAVTLAAWQPKRQPPAWVSARVVAVIAAGAAGAAMWAARSNVLNPDGRMFAPKFARDVPALGAFVTHDEMLEFLVHSRLWVYANRWWGWSIEQTYQAASCAGGAVFVYLLFRLARRLAPNAPALFLLGVLGGGYMQLFFGDVENYTLTAVVVTGYLLASHRHLAGEVPLWVPSVTLALAGAFHLLAAWLIPTWLVLCVVEFRRSPRKNDIANSVAAAAAVMAVVLVLVQFYGLPLRNLVSSHAGRALRMQGMFVTGWSSQYYFEQLNLLFLLCPAVLMLIWLAAWNRLTTDVTGVFLAVGGASMLIFQAAWRSQIGVYNDWNLYAIGALVVAVLVWRSIALAATTRSHRLVAAGLAMAALLHSAAWIMANHTHGR